MAKNETEWWTLWGLVDSQGEPKPRGREQWVVLGNDVNWLEPTEAMIKNAKKEAWRKKRYVKRPQR